MQQEAAEANLSAVLGLCPQKTWEGPCLCQMGRCDLETQSESVLACQVSWSQRRGPRGLVEMGQRREVASKGPPGGN